MPLKEYAVTGVAECAALMVFTGRMIREYGFPEDAGIEVGVNLGGRDGFVTEHVLYCAEVGTTLYQVRGKGMPESVGTNALVDARPGHGFLDQVENGYPAQFSAKPVQENNILIALLDVHHWPPDTLDVQPDLTERLLSDRHQSFLVILAQDHDEPNIKEYVG